MKKVKKIFTRMLLNNWGGIEHQVIHFHEFVNLFSGKSGSGKSTVMDAVQVVLYGSVGNDFLNKAADDSKNKRSIFSYLRGEQKDGTSNRENRDFYSTLVLELKDTGKQKYYCIGAVFEVGKNDIELKRYNFFTHEGKMEENFYLTEENVPYSISQIRTFIAKKEETHSPARNTVNKVYTTKESYINILNDVIFGYVDAQRFKTMQKSAITLKMDKGTGQFIKDYMFPRSEKNTISAISEQLGAYREIRERVEIIEHQIQLLDEISQHDKAYTQSRYEQVRTENFMKILDIEEKKVVLEAHREDLEREQRKAGELSAAGEQLAEALGRMRDELSEVKAELRSTDFEKKKEQLQQLEETIGLCANEAGDWRELGKRLNRWCEEEGITDHISNIIYNYIKKFVEQGLSEEEYEKLRRGLKQSFDDIIEELEDYKEECRKAEREYREKNDILQDLKNDKKHFSKELKEARRLIQERLSDRYGQTIHVNVLADLFDIKDEEWRNAIEGRLGRTKYALVVEPQFALDAANIFRSMKKREFETVDLIDTDAIQRDSHKVEENSLYEAVSTEIPYVDLCLKRYLGHIIKCDTTKELHEVKDGVTKDCYSYSNYMFRHLREKDYRYAVIGQKVSKKQLFDLEDAVTELQEKLISIRQEISVLNQVNEFERLSNYSYEKAVRLSGAAERLKRNQQKADALQEEIKQIQSGTYIKELRKKEEQLYQGVADLEEESRKNQNALLEASRIIGEQQKDIEGRIKNLQESEEGFVMNDEQRQEVLTEMSSRSAAAIRKEKVDIYNNWKETEQREEEARSVARMHFMKAYPSYEFTGLEKENTAYDELLLKCRNNFEPQYKEEFNKQYHLVYSMLRENVIATIHSEIKAAKRHRGQINAMLSQISFSDSIYQLDILPTDDENRQFYEMLTAEELDMKVVNEGIEHQLSFGEDEFCQKYEAQIQRLTDKFIPPKDGDAVSNEKHRKEMEKYADYRTYLKFSMYEQIENPDGTIKKNYVDDMAGRDSGGEGQNPKYVALLAGFAMLYLQQNNRESKIRVVLLDEAFSKMDKERSEVCLHYARQLGLQLIVCVPDERLQSLVRNVDCVYAFRRANNKISMIHIDKGRYLSMLEGIEDGEEADKG